MALRNEQYNTTQALEVIEKELVPFINVILTKKPKYNPKLGFLRTIGYRL